jgi:hypothetical protein
LHARSAFVELLLNGVCLFQVRALCEPRTRLRAQPCDRKQLQARPKRFEGLRRSARKKPLPIASAKVITDR